MNRSRKIGLVAVFSLTFAGAAWGDVLNESCTTLGPSGTDFTAGDVQCGRFNVAGATLNSITITVNGADTGSITLTNNNTTDDTSATGTITTTYSLDSALSGFAFSAPLFQILMSVGPAPITANGGTLSNTALTGSNAAGPLVDNNAGTFGGYTGGSFFDIFVDTTSSFGLSVSPSGNGTNTNAAESDTVSATASVTFNYTPASTGTPEPGTALLLGLGAMFVVFGARRRKA
jgi:PEP-CTERM motif